MKITPKKQSLVNRDENYTIAGVLNNERIRYKRKGIFLILAVFICISYFWITPKVGKWAWNRFGFHSLPRERFYVLSVSIMHTFAMTLWGLVFFSLYKLKIPFFERMRVNPSKKWIWEGDQGKWKDMRTKTIKTLLFNNFVLVPVFLSLDTFIGLKLRTDLESFPSLLEFFFQTIFVMICEDFGFYWSHRLLHIPYLYQNIHKQHHEYDSPFSVTAEYAHPLEFIFGNILPNAIGWKILGSRAHLFTMQLWLIWRIYATQEVHAGYEIKFSPIRVFPMTSSAEFHDFHHSDNVGNFASFFTYWDFLFKTNQAFLTQKLNKFKDL